MSAIAMSEQDLQPLAQRGDNGAARSCTISRQGAALFLADTVCANPTPERPAYPGLPAHGEAICSPPPVKYSHLALVLR
jgi:hypothetical protein